MGDNIIEFKTLPSGITGIVLETSPETAALEIGSNCIFFHREDVPGLLELLHALDKHFLKN